MLPAAHHEEVCKVPSSYRAGTNLSMHDLILVYSECAQKSSHRPIKIYLEKITSPGVAAFGGAELSRPSGHISRHRFSALRAEPLHHVREDVFKRGVEALCAVEALHAVHSRPCSAGVMFHRSLCFVHPSFTSLIAQRNTAIFQENLRKRRKKEGAVFDAPPSGYILRRPSAALA